MAKLPPFNFDSAFPKPSISEDSKPRHHKEPEDTSDLAWVHTTQPPLFWECIAEHQLSLKLSNMKAALLAGADPNEMDHERDPRRSLGRPLHCALGDWGNPEYVKDNIAVIKLLLEHGADPRLPGPEVRPAHLGLQSPLEYARRLAFHEWRGDDELLESGYYEEAYRVMKEAADKLDRE